MYFIRNLIFALLLLLLVTAFPSQGQQKYTLSGYIKDASPGEELTGATVRVAEPDGSGTVSNVF